MQSRWITKDGEKIIVFSKAEGPTAWDPTGTCWGVAQAYKVVADGFSTTLVLVPLGVATKIKTEDVNQHPEIEEALK